MSRFSLVALFSMMLVGFWLVGCGGTDKKGGSAKVEEHHHDHEEEGPHSGHLVELHEPGQEVKEEFHAEWLHEESGKITVYILDGKGKKEVPIAAESVTIKIKVGDKTDSYDLPALDRTTGDKPTAFKFETESKELLGKLEALGETVKASIHIDMNGKPYEGAIEHHEHEPGHKH
jgi:hypothetical protein